MPSRTKDQILTDMDTFAQAMITDRSEADIQDLLDLLSIAYDDMTAEEKVMITQPHRGAYNPSDRIRVSCYCNDLYAIMDLFYGITVAAYESMAENWDQITDPTSEDLENYIDNIIILIEYWCNAMSIPNTYSAKIGQIYRGINLQTANTIEEALLTIHEAINKFIFSIDFRYCGQCYGPNSTYAIPCGYSLQNDTSQYGLWTGAS